MRILIATDAWRPQVNGVVSTLERMTQAAAELGAEQTGEFSGGEIKKGLLAAFLQLSGVGAAKIGFDYRPTDGKAHGGVGGHVVIEPRQRRWKGEFGDLGPGGKAVGAHRLGWRVVALHAGVKAGARRYVVGADTDL